jgi:hypothetical protein
VCEREANKKSNGCNKKQKKLDGRPTKKIKRMEIYMAKVAAYV